MESFSKLLTAISSIAWPTITIIIFIMILPIFENFYGSENVKIKIGDLEISASKAAQDQIDQLSDVQVRIARLEESTDLQNVRVFLENPGKILWVDDRPENNAVEIALLQAQNIQVETRRSTLEALEFIEKNTNNLRAVISDTSRIEGGTKNPAAGSQLIRELQDLEIAVPIIIYTSPSLPDARRQLLLDNGASSVVTSQIDLIKELGL